MTFKTFLAGIVLFGMGAFAPSFAGCVNQVTGDIGNNFSSAVMCTNTLPNPAYQISYYEDNDVMFSLFSFDKINAGYMCISHGEVEGDNLQCRKTGLRPVPNEFENGGSLVTTFDLSSSTKQRAFAELFSDDFDFSTAKNAAQAERDQCFVGLRGNDVFIAFDSTEIYPLSNCLFAFEVFLADNPKVWLRLN
ncbi:MAG: hypothetical protein CMF22_08940 [Idiomarinaceae bacterium]|nr:hypothetical protein [Idiomarinaceae bacterium]|tara:strand:+ start:207 stop:782 length:576 start_codon:yes stop_codon:yes gene_type:complete